MVFEPRSAGNKTIARAERKLVLWRLMRPRGYFEPGLPWWTQDLRVARRRVVKALGGCMRVVGSSP